MVGAETTTQRSNISRLVELSDSDSEPPHLTSPQSANIDVPKLYTELPLLHDNLITETSRLQDQTVDECLLFLQGDYGDLSRHGIPHLQRTKHIRFLHQTLKTLPQYFVALDASRPWIMYWATAGLSMLGEPFSDDYRTRLADTLGACQHPDGGFGGGHGQYSHLACSYAAVLALVATGGSHALDVVDRNTMWHWLGRMKQPDGSFTMCEGGETDVRGAFCAMVIASLLCLPLELSPSEAARTGRRSLDDGLAEWIAGCQTVEGGIAAAPGSEAHGAYAFCALGCLCILGSPAQMIPKYMDIDSLYAWLAHRQYNPEGGFAGRTNKLVDGCYSHWVGGCWALLEAAIGPNLWDREGLLRYILCCAQGEKGGLRDKPSKNVDGYHTCYNLAGLGWAQYKHVCSGSAVDGLDATIPLSAAFQWRLDGPVEDLPVDEEDRVLPAHPIYVIPADKVHQARKYFEAKRSF